jgi:CHAT domain-containing protein/tetratricopeptide (TPR) repeat protein
VRRGRQAVHAVLILLCAAARLAAQEESTPQAEGRRLLDAGRYAEAESFARQALSRTEASHGAEALEVARVLLVLVEARLRQGQPDAEARALSQRCTRILEAFGDDQAALLGQSLHYDGVIGIQTGAYGDAESAWQRALAVRRRVLDPDHPDVGRSLTTLGQLYFEIGDQARARPYLEAALQQLEKSRGPEHTDVAMALSNLANSLAVLGMTEEAFALHKRALDIRERALGPDDEAVAWSLNDMADALVAMERYAEAQPLYERSAAVLERQLGPNHHYVGTAHGNLSRVQRKLGDHAAAAASARRALAIHEKSMGPQHPYVGFDLCQLGDAVGAMGDAQEARSLFERGLAIEEKALGAHHPFVTSCRVGLAETLAAAGAAPEALAAALEAEGPSRDHLRLTARALSEREALAYAAGRTSGLDVALGVLARHPDLPSGAATVWDALVRSRALVLDEMATRRRAVSEARDPDVARLVGELAAARERLVRLVVRGPGDDAEGERARVDEARAGKERLERALAEASASFRREQARTRVGFEDVAAALPGDAALLAYVRSNRSPAAYVAFVLRGGTREPVVVPLGAAATVESTVAEWRRQVLRGAAGRSPRRSVAAYRDAGAALRREVWDPVIERAGGATRVFVVPDGALNLVDFAALPAGRGSYVVEGGPLVHYLSAERDLVGPESARAWGAGLLALGAPDFDAARTDPRAVATSAGAFRGPLSACRGFRSLRFEPLPAAGSEVRDVLALWSRRRGRDDLPGDGAALTGAAASEAAFKAQAPGHRLLHLATHGFFLGGDCPEKTPRAENPLLRAGLALAGANQRERAGPTDEDGVLTAEEVAALDLGGVQWAVLSACDTGLGEVRAGEGVLGLRRAFQLAGAGTVVMSLWPVDDATSRRWMNTLYERHFIAGSGTAESVREASLALLHERRKHGRSTHPIHWAGFVAAGDWR